MSRPQVCHILSSDICRLVSSRVNWFSELGATNFPLNAAPRLFHCHRRRRGGSPTSMTIRERISYNLISSWYRCDSGVTKVDVSCSTFNLPTPSTIHTKAHTTPRLLSKLYSITLHESFVLSGRPHVPSNSFSSTPPNQSGSVTMTTRTSINPMKMCLAVEWI